MRPLDDQQLNRIKANWPSLTELITLEGGLLAKLYAIECITKIQKKSIESAGDDVDQNERLLEIMLRKSVADFNRFIECLQDTQQGHVASYLLTEDAGKQSVSNLKQESPSVGGAVQNATSLIPQRLRLQLLLSLVPKTFMHDRALTRMGELSATAAHQPNM